MGVGRRCSVRDGMEICDGCLIGFQDECLINLLFYCVSTNDLTLAHLAGKSNHRIMAMRHSSALSEG